MPVVVDRPAAKVVASLNRLGWWKDEQERVAEVLASLVDKPAAQWPEDLARRLPGDPPRYLVRVDDSLRAVVEVAEGSYFSLAMNTAVRYC